MTTKGSRRARASLEAKLWAVERAFALGGDVATARATWDAALAKRIGRGEIDGDDAGLFDRRVAHLYDAFTTGFEAVTAYGAQHGIAGVRAIETNKGARIVRLVAETLPGHVNYAYVLDIDGQRVLFDVGTGLFGSRQELLDGMTIAARYFGARAAQPADIDLVFVSHGHIDHFGDAAWWKKASGAPVWVHELDARVLENFTERAVLTGRDMRLWLSGSGVDAAEVDRLVEMYLSGKDQFTSVPVDRRLRHGDRLFHDRARVIHTPGHCPGHVCLRVDDALLVGDQVLSPITPHITPQALNPHNGLERYLFGLGRLMLEDGVAHVLPAHYDPIPDLRARIMGCAEDHVEKLKRTVDACRSGATIADVAATLFGAQEGYSVLLALLEAGTHVEYLHQLGALVVNDLDAVQRDPNAAIRYVATEAAAETAEASLQGQAVLGGG
jgi:glyoxylase-like metal-dependent hydrolase (beta-lactamase superfamily II)